MKKILILPSFLSLTFLLPVMLPAAVDFEKDVWPIFGSRCISCHGAPYKDTRGRRKTAKGGLRLDSPERIKMGAEENPDVLVPGDAKEGTLVELLLLPEDHDDVMPPKDGLLTAEQIKVVTDWVNEGANFGDWRGLPEEYDYKALKEKNGW